MKRLLLLATLAILAITNIYWLHAGLPFTHDGENHLARFANYKVAIKELQFPPRFAPNLLNHYGYPVFNYNYPLANILSLPFSVLGISYETTFKLLVMFSLLLGSAGVIRWLSSHTKQKLPILLALIAFLSGPPLISTLFFRGSIGEIMAYSLFPWLLWTLENANKKASKKVLFAQILLWAVFFLSHNISMLLGAYLFAIVALVQLLRSTNKLQFVTSVASVVTPALGLTIWFWLPALMEIKEVVVSTAANQTAYAEHFATLKQLLFSPVQFGFSYSGPTDTLGFSIGWIAIVTLLLAAIVLVIKILSRKHLLKNIPALLKQLPCPYLFLSICLFLLQLSLSAPLWKVLPGSRLIQFPWRLGLFLTIFSLPVLVWLYEQLPKHFRKFLIAIVLMQFLIVLFVRPTEFIHKSNLEYDLFGGTTSTQNENVPHTFKYLLIGDWKPEPTVLSGVAEVATIETWSGSYRKYRLNVYGPATIVEPTMRYLGWQTKVRSITDSGKNQRNMTYTDSDNIQGRIAYKLDPGLYEVTSSFTQWTPARVVGNAVSSLSLVGLIGYAIIFGHEKRKQ